MEEKLRFPSSSSGKFWIGGWHVDQDDESSNGQFDQIYMNANSINGYSYPYSLTNIESTDNADASQSGTMWTRFYVFNSTKYFGLGYVYLDSMISSVTLNSFDSYWINEGSSNDWTYFFSDSGSLDSDGGDRFYFYIMAGRKVEVVFNFHINDPLGFWDDAEISVAIYDPSGSQVPGQYYYSGEPAPQDGQVVFDFDASSTGWYYLDFDYDSAEDWGTNDDRMSWSSYMVYLTSDYSYIYDDYLLWGNRFDIDASAGGQIDVEYAMIPWYGYGEDWYNNLAGHLESSPTIDLSSDVEQYYSEVTVYVKDSDGKPVENVFVSLDGSSSYNGTTNKYGYVTFTVERGSYTCTAKVVSNGLEYTNITSISISYDYLYDKYVEYVFVMDIVKLSIKFLAADEITTIQGAKLVLTSTSYGSVINITSDLEAMAEVYIRPDVWHVSNLEYAYPGSYYDNFSLKDVITEEYINDINGLPVANVSEADINISCGQSWMLIDHMAEDVKPASKFELYYGSLAQTVQWGRVLEWQIKWVDQYGKFVDLRDGNISEGDYFMWELRYADNDSLVYLYGAPLRKYYTPSNVSMCINDTSSGPVYVVLINTSILSADVTYYIVIDGIINFLQKPQQLYLFINLESIPTISSLDIASEVYWNETLDVKLYIWDSEGNPLSGASVKLEIYDSYQQVVYSSNILETDAGLYATSLKCNFAPGRYYVKVSYSKQNYAPGYVPMRDLFIMERPTMLQFTGINPSPIEFSFGFIKMYWGNYYVGFGFEFSDGISFAIMNDITAVANLYEITPNGSMPVLSVEAVYNSTLEEYWFFMNLSDLNVGSYRLEVEFSKTNYETQRFETTIVIIERPTSINLASDYIVGYYNELVSARFYLEDMINRSAVKLSSDDLNVRVRDIESGIAINVSIATYSNGTCIIYFPQTLNPSKYFVRISIDKQNYQKATKEFYVEIKDRPTYASSTSKYSEVIWGDYATFYFWYVDTLVGKLIEDAQTEVRVLDSMGNEILSLPLVLAYYQGNEMFILKFNTSVLRSEETYDIVVEFSKENFESKELIVKLYVNPLLLDVEYDESITILKNPITNEAKTRISIKLYDVSKGHEKHEYRAEKVRYILYSSVGQNITAGEFTYIEGEYYAEIDLTNVHVGTYVLEVSFILRNASLSGESNIIYIKINLDYWGGTVEILGRKYPTVLVIPILTAIFLLVGTGLYYAWVLIHIPWEIKYINQLLKKLRKGETEFEAVERDPEVLEVARSLLEGE